ncbi:MAG: glucose 1-dehydrogenase [Moorea sp. SIOASIH]|uniref:glucose 1-dehydrogenase n=1 Tax=Moorena sp. SIOASIH TaxID=2607817 RepID=UPI0013BD9EC3|nr:glucose 1-dehydrogenase [Moorena sp. SIOASIH]NEO42112.1 glucose 1-dehydrogenase [Moorena sp. SIOASIH]
MKKLKNKIAVVTGGNSGIGLATAKAFVREGAKVIIMGRNSVTLKQAVQALGEDAVGVQGDVSNLNDIDRLYEKVNEVYGYLDILFVNAGINRLSKITQITEDLFDEIINVNLKGAFFTIQKALPLLKDRSSIILNTSAIAALGIPEISIYSASKAALRSLARTISVELLDRKIRVNAVAPGAVETSILSRYNIPQEKLVNLGSQCFNRIPTKRIGSVEEVAKAVVFLASDDASYIIGCELAVDGGMTQL